MSRNTTSLSTIKSWYVSFFRIACQRPDCIDSWYCGRYPSPPFYGSSRYPWRFESGPCLLYTRYSRTHTVPGKGAYRRRRPTAHHGLCTGQGTLCQLRPQLLIKSYPCSLRGTWSLKLPVYQTVTGGLRQRCV